MHINKQRYSVAILIAAGLGVLMISGCMVGPEYHPPQPVVVPPAWEGISKILSHQPYVTTSQPADLTRWWRQFNDPVLNELVDEAVKANLDLKIAEANLRQARALGGIAIGGLLPSVAASAGYERLHNAATMPGSLTEDLYQAGLDAAWELDLAHAGCLWAARLSAASTSGASGAAQSTRMAGRAAMAGHDSGRVAPRAQGPTPVPTQPDCPERSRADGPAALGPR